MKYSINRYLQPATGNRVYGGPGNLKGGLPSCQQQEHRIGTVQVSAK